MAHLDSRRTLLLSALLALVCAVPTMARAQQVQQQSAILVIQFSDQSYFASCVSFGSDSINGLDLLRRAGLEVATWGTAVCRIEETGCNYPGERCFCQCLAAPCRFWSYWQWRDGHWVYSQIGAGQHQVRDGDAEAWVWGDGQTPPTVTPAEVICPSEESLSAVRAGPAATLDQPQSPSVSPSVNTGTFRDRTPGIDTLYREYAIFAAISAALLSSFFWLRLQHQGQ